MKSPLTQAMVLLAFILLLAGGGGLGVVYLKTQITATAREIKVLENEQARLARQHHSLDAQLAALHNPDSLRRRARELGLYPPREEQIVRLPATPEIYLSEAANRSR